MKKRKTKLCPECRGEGGYCDTCEGRGHVRVPQHYDSSASIAAGGISSYSANAAPPEIDLLSSRVDKITKKDKPE